MTDEATREPPPELHPGICSRHIRRRLANEPLNAAELESLIGSGLLLLRQLHAESKHWAVHRSLQTLMQRTAKRHCDSRETTVSRLTSKKPVTSVQRKAWSRYRKRRCDVGTRTRGQLRLASGSAETKGIGFRAALWESCDTDHTRRPDDRFRGRRRRKTFGSEGPGEGGTEKTRRLMVEGTTAGSRALTSDTNSNGCVCFASLRKAFSTGWV